MIGDPYRTVDDPACYEGTTVLINLADIRDQAALDAFEGEAVGRRSLQAPPPGDFDSAHYRALHRHLFKDVYEWAGDYRNIRTAKDGSIFCYPENISNQMAKLFRTLDQPAFLLGGEIDAFIVSAADFLGDLNAIHPFRDGNGRTQLFFVRLLGLRANHLFRSEAVERDAFLLAMIDSFHCKQDALIDELERMLA